MAHGADWSMGADRNAKAILRQVGAEDAEKTG